MWQPSPLATFLLSRGLQTDKPPLPAMGRDDWFGLLAHEALPTPERMQVLKELAALLNVDWQELVKLLLKPEAAFVIREHGEVWTPKTKAKVLGIRELLLVASPHLPPDERVLSLGDLNFLVSPRMAQHISDQAAKYKKPTALYREVQVNVARNMLTQDLQTLAQRARRRGLDAMAYFDQTVDMEDLLPDEMRIYTAESEGL